jgi:hypothetical protein
MVQPTAYIRSQEKRNKTNGDRKREIGKGKEEANSLLSRACNNDQRSFYKGLPPNAHSTSQYLPVLDTTSATHGPFRGHYLKTAPCSAFCSFYIKCLTNLSLFLPVLYNFLLKEGNDFFSQITHLINTDQIEDR